jgi:U3 small nucleolar RNA-associated protein MPP10
VKKIKPRGKNRSLRDDSSEEGDDDDEEEGPAFHDEESWDDDDEDDSELHEDEDEEDVGISATTIQRLKNDLFAEDDEEENGEC